MSADKVTDEELATALGGTSALARRLARELTAARSELAYAVELSDSLLDTFGPLLKTWDGAENWAGVDYVVRDGERWTLSMQRVDGKTPPERLNELTAELAAAKVDREALREKAHAVCADEDVIDVEPGLSFVGTVLVAALRGEIEK